MGKVTAGSQAAGSPRSAWSGPTRPPLRVAVARDYLFLFLIVCGRWKLDSVMLACWRGLGFCGPVFGETRIRCLSNILSWCLISPRSDDMLSDMCGVSIAHKRNFLQAQLGQPIADRSCGPDPRQGQLAYYRWVPGPLVQQSRGTLVQ